VLYQVHFAIILPSESKTVPSMFVDISVAYAHFWMEFYTTVKQ